MVSTMKRMVVFHALRPLVAFPWRVFAVGERGRELNRLAAVSKRIGNSETAALNMSIGIHALGEGN